MRLTRYERLVLANQYRLLEILSGDPSEARHFAEHREAVVSGYEDFYFPDDLYRDQHVLTAEDTHEVLEILSMHDALAWSFSQLDESSRDGLSESDVVFKGFSGNEETTRMGFVEFFCSRGGERAFERVLKAGPLNSHVPLLAAYRRMLTAWLSLGKPHDMTAGQIRQVIAERVHPDNRQ